MTPLPPTAAFALRRQAALTIAALVVLGLIGLTATLGPLLWRTDPLALSVADAAQAPSWAHPMGTDSVGRDVLARFMRGAQISLIVGIVVVLLGSAVGGSIGVVAGMYGGWRDNVMMRCLDAVLAFPPIILAMAITVSLGVGLRTAVIGIIVTTIPYYARLVRSEVIKLRGLPFIEAAVASGASTGRIMARHIVPHVLPLLVVQGASVFGYSILAVAGLGFIGLGAQIPTAEWGTMITEGFQSFLTGDWWMGVFPGVGLMLVVMAMGVLSDAGRDALDPRGSRQGA